LFGDQQVACRQNCQICELNVSVVSPKSMRSARDQADTTGSCYLRSRIGCGKLRTNIHRGR